MCGRIESAKKCGEEAEIGGKCANLISSNAVKVAEVKGESWAILSVPKPTKSDTALPVKIAVKVHSKSARNFVLMIWCAILEGRDRGISEWKPLKWPHFREAAEVEQQIARSKAGCSQPIPNLARVPAEPCKIMFFLARLDVDWVLIQSAAKLPGTHYRTVIYALNVNRTRNWSRISIKFWIRFLGYPN